MNLIFKNKRHDITELAAGHFGGKFFLRKLRRARDADGPVRDIMFHNDVQSSRKHFQMDAQRHYVQCAEISFAAISFQNGILSIKSRLKL